MPAASPNPFQHSGRSGVYAVLRTLAFSAGHLLEVTNVVFRRGTDLMLDSGPGLSLGSTEYDFSLRIVVILRPERVHSFVSQTVWKSEREQEPRASSAGDIP